eukprot:4771580-Pyramimonas_sp.AAC.1
MIIVSRTPVVALPRLLLGPRPHKVANRRPPACASCQRLAWRRWRPAFARGKKLQLPPVARARQVLLCSASWASG